MFNLNPVVKIYCLNFFDKIKTIHKNKNEVKKKKKNRTLNKKPGDTC